jgi:hypothetical protein
LVEIGSSAGMRLNRINKNKTVLFPWEAKRTSCCLPHQKGTNWLLEMELRSNFCWRLIHVPHSQCRWEFILARWSPWFTKYSHQSIVRLETE